MEIVHIGLHTRIKTDLTNPFVEQKRLISRGKSLSVVYYQLKVNNSTCTSVVFFLMILIIVTVLRKGTAEFQLLETLFAL